MTPTSLQSNDELAQRVRAVRERLIRDGTTVINPDRSTIEMCVTAITVGEGEALGRWVRREQATKTIEIGLAFGVSALHICEALEQASDPGARHVVLDPFQARSFANRRL